MSKVRKRGIDRAMCIDTVSVVKFVQKVVPAPVKVEIFMIIEILSIHSSRMPK
jgi:hypothetical protein